MKKNSKKWKLLLVGPVTKNFKKYIEKLYKEKPRLKKRIKVLWNINDIKELNMIYQKASIYCVTSTFESFNLIVVEAMANGCFLISSRLSSIEDILVKKEYSLIFEQNDLEGLCKTLVRVCNNGKKYLNEKRQTLIQNYIYENNY